MSERYLRTNITDDYPDSDHPWTFYFQGKAMPKWSNCWHWQTIAESRVGSYVDLVITRIDHVGTIESEESENFTIAAQQTLIALIDQKEALSPYPAVSVEETQEIYENLIKGIQEMISISEQHDVVFWTSGYDDDQKMIQDAIARFELGETHADYLEPPHRVRQRNQRLFELNWQRKELRRRIDTIGRDKALKTFLHNLKDKKD